MITPVDNYTAPETPQERARQHELMVASAEVFAAATDLARDRGVELIAHGTRHYEIIDGERHVHVFVVEQRIEGTNRTLMTLGMDWDIYDVLDAYLIARGEA